MKLNFQRVGHEITKAARLVAHEVAEFARFAAEFGDFLLSHSHALQGLAIAGCIEGTHHAVKAQQWGKAAAFATGALAAGGFAARGFVVTVQKYRRKKSLDRSFAP